MTRKLSRAQAALTAALAGAAVLAGGLLTGTALGSKTPAAAAAGRAKTTTGMKMGNGMPMPMPVPIQPIGQAVWQGMKIQARLSTALPFVVVQGTTARTVKPTKKQNAHLMVMLSDAQTGKAIPYGTVWGTLRKAGKIVFDERLWPMISRYMGTHFGNNVALPGSGTYTLSLLVGPPQSARHMEYAHVWLKPHRVTITFHWKKPK